MGKMTKKQIIALIVLISIIIAGIAITLTLGFNFELKMQDAKKIELYLQKNFEISHIKNIINEVMNGQSVIIQKVEVFEDSVSIVAKDITEEQKQSIIEKINEKYQTELNAESIEIITIPNTRGRELLKPYVVPFTISTVLILVYMTIKYRKLGSITTVLKVMLIMVISQALLFSIIAITRIPIGRLTIPMVVTVYIVTILAITAELEKQLKSKIEEENRKSKKS